MERRGARKQRQVGESGRAPRSRKARGAAGHVARHTGCTHEPLARQSKGEEDNDDDEDKGGGGDGGEARGGEGKDEDELPRPQPKPNARVGEREKALLPTSRSLSGTEGKARLNAAHEIEPLATAVEGSGGEGEGCDMD